MAVSPFQRRLDAGVELRERQLSIEFEPAQDRGTDPSNSARTMYLSNRLGQDVTEEGSFFAIPWFWRIKTVRKDELCARREEDRLSVHSAISGNPANTMTGFAARIETGLADRLPTLLEYRAFAGEMAERLKARAC